MTDKQIRENDGMTLTKATMIMRTVEAALNKGNQHITISQAEGTTNVSIWPDDSVGIKEVAQWLDEHICRADFDDFDHEAMFAKQGWEGLIRWAIEDGEFDGDD